MNKKLLRSALSLLLSLAILVSLLAGLSLTASAAVMLGTYTGYTSASQVVYNTSGGYVANWGARGENATFLTTYAQNYYTGNYSYATLSAKSGSSTATAAAIYSSALGSAIHSMLESKQTYTTSYDGTKNLYKYTDCVNGNTSYISSYYSGTQLNGEWGSSPTWNREHTWPNSKGSGSSENDIMMLRPTATSENSSRGNTAYGAGSSYYDPNSEAGSNTNINLHGDVARLMLQHLMRWGNTEYFYGSSGVMESRAVLLSWMEEDPVDTWEMGRNDAVQSITGVRNVFVDYPELAFKLLGASVPSGYTTPSSGSSTSSYTVTATSNNTTYGTVTVSGTTISASPKTGYTYANPAYTVTSGSATVTQNGDTFTVNPSSDCTVRINFAAKQSVTLTFTANGSQYSTASAYTGEATTLPATATSVNGWTFSGWSTSTIQSTTTKPTYYAPGASYTPTAATTFYAVYTKTESSSGSGSGNNTFTKVTSAPTDWSGEYVLSDENSEYVLLCDGTQAVGSTNAAVALTGTGITLSGTTMSNVADKYVLVVESAGSGYYSFKLKGSSSNAYLMTTDSNSGFNTASDNSADTAKWTISCTSGIITISNKANSRVIRSNTSTHQFRAYSSGQLGILLYAGTAGSTTTYTTNPTNATHTHSTSYVAAVAATCGVDGHSAYYYCAGCGKYFSNSTATTEITQASTVIAATGNHTYGSWTSDGASGHTRTCSVCGNTETAAHTLSTVTNADGSTTTSCTVCSYSYNTAAAEVYSLTNQLVAGAKVVLYNPHYGKAVSNEDLSSSYPNYRAGVDVAPSNGQITDPDTAIVWTVTAADGGFYLADAAGHKLSIGTSGLRLDSTNDVWTLNTATTSNCVYVVSTTATGSSGDAKMIEWYPNYSEFSTYYYQSSNENYYAMQIFSDTAAAAPHTHTPAAAVQENVVAATCTVAGSYNSVIYCSECGAEISRESVTIPALGHTSSYVDNGDGTHDEVCSVCGTVLIDNQAHVLNNGVCTLCGATALQILSAELVLNGKIDVAYNVSVPTGYSNPRMVFTFNGVNTTVTDYTTENGNLKFTFTGINPQCMGDKISATLYATKNGTEENVSEANYSVKDYCVNKLADNTISASLRKLLSDMLAYGAAAQTYMNYKTNALVTSGTINNPTYSTFSNLSGNAASFDGTADANTYWLSAGLTLTDSAAMTFRFHAASVSNLIVYVSINGRTQEFTAFTNEGNGVYSVTFTGISAEEYGETVTAAFERDGNQLGNELSYSVNAYVQSKQEDSTASLAALVKALYNYGASAAAYAG